LALALVACGGDGEPVNPDTAVADTGTPDMGAPEVVEPECCGSVQGTVVNTDGDFLVGAYVLVCNADFCVSGETDTEGNYDVGDLTLVDYKIKVQGSQLGYANMLFFQALGIKGAVQAPRDLVVVSAPEAMTPWTPEEGGTVTLAEGQLELTAAAGDLKYPLGFAKEVLAVPVPADALPPYDQEPWKGAEDGTVAFHINPVGVVTLSGVIEARVKDAQAAAGTVYGVWTVDDHTAHVERVGTATADSAGDIVVDESAAITMLSTLLFIPE